MRVIRLLGSLPVAISLLAILVGLLSFSTVYESLHGTPQAQQLVYRAGWFDALLALFAVNIFCAAASRYPFKKHHIGFVTTHAGILLLLTGALLARTLGEEGQMQLFEGQEGGRMLLEGRALRLESRAGKKAMSLEKGHLPSIELGGARVSVLEDAPNSVVDKRLVEGGPDDAANAAIEAIFSSERAGITDQPLLLVEHDPANPHSSFTQMGPATVELKTSDPGTAATLRVVRKSDGKNVSVALPRQDNTPVAIEGTNLRLERIEYYPQAKVKEGRLVDAPEEIRFNPAVEFDAVDETGRRETHTRFFLFPQFASRHGGESTDAFGLEVGLTAEMPSELTAQSGPSLTFFAPASGAWSYRSTSTKSGSKEGPVDPGGEITTGWMDMRVRVKNVYRRAKIIPETRPAKPGEPVTPAAKVRVEAGGASVEMWVSDEPVSVKTPEGPLTISLGPESKPVPFFLKLIDFRKTDYPGTTKAASFESDVTLTDPEAGLSLKKTISMNKPLDYKGYRIFQSSYMQDAEVGEGSVFTVAKNPGIAFIYTGAVVILVGVILLFYLHPFFNDRVKVR